MESKVVIEGIEWVARGLEFLGVALIGFSFLFATIRALLHVRDLSLEDYQRIKINIGKALQMGLEFLVAADIIRTVTITPTREGIVTLGLLIMVRTFLSWSITVEIEGRWPWQGAAAGKD
jgi:uncharacterized membrane protein